MNDERPFDQHPAAGDDPTSAQPTAVQHSSADAPAAAEPLTAEAPPTDGRRRGHRIAAASTAAVLIFAAGAGTGIAGASVFGGSTTSTSSFAQGGTTQGGTSQGGLSQGGMTQGGTSQGGTGLPGGGFGNGFGGGFGSQGGSQSGTGTGSGTTTTRSTQATSAQSTGVVTIVSTLGYESGESAGTGIVLTSSGEILTNNHVIDGATAIQVTVPSTGKTYTATVVGTNAKKDIAVLQLKGASGLTTAPLSDTAAKTGDEVTGVGNAGGTGTLTAAEGSVTATGQTITTSAEGSTAGETLHGLIETDADIMSGDSGGPLLNASGRVVGIDTAASAGTSDTTGYAITIDDALDVATQIIAGKSTSDITIGLPAFLGVGLSQRSTAPLVSDVFDDTPAAAAGLSAGSTITALDGVSVATATALHDAIAKHAPGDRVSITWTTSSGTSHTATVTLIAGPAD